MVRYGWFGDRWVEILDCSPEAVVMDRAKDYLPLFVNHNSSDQIGSHENVRLDGKELKGAMRFSASQRGRDMRQDVLDGHRPKTSVGYFVHEMVLEKSDKESGIDYYRVTKWEPVENSLAGIPADPSAGRRSAERETRQVVVRSLIGATPQEPAVKTDPTAPTGAPNNTDRVTGVNEERSRIAEIDSLWNQHALPAEARNELVNSGASIESARGKALDLLRERAKTPTSTGQPAITLNEKEQKQYSFARAMLAGDPESKVDAGFELEISRELQRKLPASIKYNGGVLIPTRFASQQIQTRAGLDSATATKGQELKFTQPGEFIEMLRARMKVLALGARILSGLTGPVSFPKQTAAATLVWAGENPGSDVADSNLLLTLVTLSPKTAIATTSFSRQLLVSALSGSIDAEQMVREDLAKINALGIDSAAIQGTGASNQPTGVLSTAGIGSVAGGTNGAAATYANIVDLETAVANANADVESMGYLSTPVQRGKLKQVLNFAAAAAGQPVWGKGEMNGYKAEASTQVPSNLTKGTAAGICHAILFGDWSQLVIGEWGAFEVITDPYRLKKQGMIEVTTFQMADIVLRQAAAFSAMKDAL